MKRKYIVPYQVLGWKVISTGKSLEVPEGVTCHNPIPWLTLDLVLRRWRYIEISEIYDVERILLGF